MSDKPSKNEYPAELIAKVAAYAQAGSSPSHIANLLELKGNDRLKFFRDITNPKNALGREYSLNKDKNSDDVDLTLNFLCMQGDTDAMLVALRKETIDYVARIKFDLFGL